jgi:hypothetical protein
MEDNHSPLDQIRQETNCYGYLQPSSMNSAPMSTTSSSVGKLLHLHDPFPAALPKDPPTFHLISYLEQSFTKNVTKLGRSSLPYNRKGSVIWRLMSSVSWKEDFPILEAYRRSAEAAHLRAYKVAFRLEDQTRTALGQDRQAQTAMAVSLEGLTVGDLDQLPEDSVLMVKDIPQEKVL